MPVRLREDEEKCVHKSIPFSNRGIRVSLNSIQAIMYFADVTEGTPLESMIGSKAAYTGDLQEMNSLNWIILISVFPAKPNTEHCVKLITNELFLY